MSNATLTPKQLELVGKMTIMPKAMEKFVSGMDALEPESLRNGAKMVRELCDVLDELATALEAPDAAALLEALSNV